MSPGSVPAAPTGVTGVNVGGIAYGSPPQVTVSWTPGSNGGLTVSSYNVTASPGGATCSSPSASSCTITSGLTAGSAYTFTVTATNSAGTGLASAASASVTPATVAQAPTIGTATYVTGIANGSSPQVAVTWTDPSNNGGSAITGYTVTANTGGGTCTVAGAASTTCTVTSLLTAGSAYTFTVKANNGAGSSAASAATARASPRRRCPGAPTIGTTTVVAGIANGTPPQAVVNWTVPASNGGSAITGYTATSSPAGGTCTVAGAAATTCTVTSGLTAGTAYTFTVIATNAAGNSANSAGSNSVTPATVAVRTDRRDRDVERQRQLGGLLDGPGHHRRLGHHRLHRDRRPAAHLHQLATTSCTVSGLTNGTAYTFTVKATNGEGTSLASPPRPQPPRPPCPARPPPCGHVQRQRPVGRLLDGAGLNGGAPITNYTVTSSPGGQQCNTSTTVAPWSA